MSAPSPLLQFLAHPSACPDADALAGAWTDMDVVLHLRGAGRAPVGIGAHLRRSFLGALGPGASPEARDTLPCPWDPPCALDVFCREQMRGPAGDGLPKPYVLRSEPDGADLRVTLRLFGIAGDWSFAAAEALTMGLRDILPWGRLSLSRPEIANRSVTTGQIVPEPAPRAVRLHLVSPMDISGRDPAREPWTILSRMIRRVDGVARWSGVGLDSDTSRAVSLMCRELQYGIGGLRLGRHHSANRHAQKRTDPVLTGALDVAGDLAPLWPLLQAAERCHIGRHAVEGLGWIRLERTIL